MKSTNRIPTADAKKKFGQVSGRVTYGKERIILTKHNQDHLALVPIEDLRLLQVLDEEVDRDTFMELKERAAKYETTPLEDLAEELGLEDELHS